VERIAATLALTKGSFYHHHDTKDALIDACFERSLALVRSVQRAALAQPGNGWQRLVAATAPLVQLHEGASDNGAGPLLRLTAWTELPGALRWQKYYSLGRLGERYAAMVVDGMLDGSIRVTDPAVAAQMIHGLINALAEVQHWVHEAPLPEGGAPLGELLARPLLMGLVADATAGAAAAQAASPECVTPPARPGAFANAMRS
jgi:AcrR family transcriptional regulator